LRAIGEPGWLAVRQIHRDFLAWALSQVKAERLTERREGENQEGDEVLAVWGRWWRCALRGGPTSMWRRFGLGLEAIMSLLEGNRANNPAGERKISKIPPVFPVRFHPR
jgi:hypothetical protein